MRQRHTAPTTPIHSVLGLQDKPQHTRTPLAPLRRRDEPTSRLGFIPDLLHPLVSRCQNYFASAGLKLRAPQRLTFKPALLLCYRLLQTALEQHDVGRCYKCPSDKLISVQDWVSLTSSFCGSLGSLFCVWPHSFIELKQQRKPYRITW